ncbi:MAG: amino acid ABC transporter permease [Candidimonas sp.]|nr:MAG: amino acid ABC transporter permease [Candidimonas sp.]TAM24074.1 MAG: amino acid ABC transporter permease [Candidimonas sp.]TAM80341.1 MAG: amino acid ABC transporter permease [Candidimonas sp.]
MMFHLEPLIDNAGYLAIGMLVTIEVTLVALALGVVGGLVVNVLAQSNIKLLRRVATVFTSVFRGTPILVQLLIAYYVPSSFGINLSPLAAASLALALNTSAFQGEIYRGGFQSLPVGQVEAAKAVGMGDMSCFLHIQIPQVFRIVLPSLFNEFILLLKASSLVSVIAVADLTRRAQQVVSASQEPLTVYVAAAIAYIVINTIIARAGRMIEKRLGVYTI